MGRNSSSVSMRGSSLLHVVVARFRRIQSGFICVLPDVPRGLAGMGLLSSGNVVCLGPCFSLSSYLCRLIVKASFSMWVA